MPLVPQDLFRNWVLSPRELRLVPRWLRTLSAVLLQGEAGWQEPPWQQELQLLLAPRRQKGAARPKPSYLPKTITEISYSFLFLLLQLELESIGEPRIFFGIRLSQTS